MNNETRQQLVIAIQSSAIKAFEKYYKETEGSCWIYNTPEYLYTTKIAEGVSKDFGSKYATFLELPLKEFRKDANKGKIGRPKKEYSEGGKTDIALYRFWKTKSNWTAEAVIEIKIGWSWNALTIGKDVKRISASLNETGKRHGLGTVSSGYLVFMTDDWGDDSKHAKSKIIKRVDNILTRIEDFLSENGVVGLSLKATIKFSKFHEECDSIAACIVYEFLEDKRRKYIS